MSETHGSARPPGLNDGENMRILDLEMGLRARNDRLAAGHRSRLQAAGTLVLNLVSSPGAGKTSLLLATLKRLARRLPVAVIEGNHTNEIDAERIRATGVAAVQLDSGTCSQLDADMVSRALDRLALPLGGVLFVENDGNLGGPRGFDLGEARRVVVASVTDGNDNPLKYPDLFAGADLLVVNKIDLLPHLDFDVDALMDNARRLNPAMELLEVSAVTGAGLERWLAWIETERQLLAA
ncbi:MAG: hydrogenase nickel incorporation protein HypB [Pseudomonadota bacterium]